MNFKYFVVFYQIYDNFVDSFMHLIKFFLLVGFLFENFLFHILTNIE